MVYGSYNELVPGAYKPTNITGAGATLYQSSLSQDALRKTATLSGA